VFRVFKSLLAAKSVIFEAMFDIPQPEAQDMYDGFPIVNVSDKAWEIFLILYAIHDHKCVLHQ
jgi:hypothetical protein